MGEGPSLLEKGLGCPGERAVLKLMYALIHAAERWRGIPITEFEQRQLKVIREELNKDFGARNARAAAAPQSHLSSKSADLTKNCGAHSRLKAHKN